MVVYFLAFIPFYAGLARPIFHLLQKGAPWIWGSTEKHAFEAAKEAYKSGQPPPKLVFALSAKVKDDQHNDVWGALLDESMVHVKCVIAYWSRLFKGPET
jgi:hypothetical protein